MSIVTLAALDKRDREQIARIDADIQALKAERRKVQARIRQRRHKAKD